MRSEGNFSANQQKVREIRKSNNNYLPKKFSNKKAFSLHISYNMLNISKKENSMQNILPLSRFFLLSLQANYIYNIK